MSLFPELPRYHAATHWSWKLSPDELNCKKKIIIPQFQLLFLIAVTHLRLSSNPMIMSDDYFGHLQFNTNPTCLIHRMFWLSHWQNINASLRVIWNSLTSLCELSSLLFVITDQLFSFVLIVNQGNGNREAFLYFLKHWPCGSALTEICTSSQMLHFNSNNLYY